MCDERYRQFSDLEYRTFLHGMGYDGILGWVGHWISIFMIIL
jgi:hypothetical protein